MLTISKIDRHDMLNNPGENKAAVTLWFSGCSRKCVGCQNDRLFDKSSGTEYSTKAILFTVCSVLEKYDMDTVILLGGEPLEQDDQSLNLLVSRLSLYGYKIWLYTGNELEDIPESIKKYVNVIKCGCYDESLKQDGFPSSSNQRFLQKFHGEWIHK